ncbi:uncharacterized protein DUF3857 [Roseimicrobium gellanilyticum]|uniref:Uncharacterized protein DUF3857 n=1 Tax=Roseimicrobium gellanilyticum TaxID=748857 RepID=A0A366HDF1_9BACT|nr:DUF3857 domain-containing protein [Roseimicrobium gellanilyticum]RBP39849.1 uncharacterized protein DUF3857 [Roseimicrobium gellanilyticum]
MLAVSALFGTAASLCAEDVSRKLPAIYEQALKSHLTPLEEVLKSLPAVPGNAEDGWVLLGEDVQYVTADGKRFLVEHEVIKALTDAGAEEIARTVRSYTRSRHKIHLALARTIQPDGTRQEVKPSASFLQSPQREADESLYHDTGELVIIFPNVKAGSIVEWIHVVEEHTPRVPGHLQTAFAFEWGWPIHRLRKVLDLPDEWAKRVKITPVGKGVPEPNPTVQKNGRTTMAWERQHIEAGRDEPSRAPFDQTGPLVRLTTFKDWNEFLDWYAPLTNKKTALGEVLETEVDKLTQGLSKPREILDRLATKVANDVRYVGLEFGDSDIEPHPVAEIWEHQYGDCKDKASLLKAMLAHKGITSHLALINTEHVGGVERRSPGVRDFNHVILRVELPEGPIFCDPTLSGVPAGIISPNDADRDVLLVKQPEQWERTPAQDAGTYSLDFEAKAIPTGEISGWATLRAHGYMASLYAEGERTRTKQQLEEFLQRRIERCYPGAEVVDVKQVPSSSSGVYEVSAYFVVPPSGALTLRFPFDAGFLPEPGDAKNRETDFFLWRDVNATKSVVKLPKGFRPSTLPAPQVLKTPQVEGKAAWEVTEEGLKATLHFEVKASRIPATEVRQLEQAVAALKTWLDRPLTLEAGEQVTTAPTGDGLGEFPMMPTGAGQLQLVYSRFPINGNLRLRRAALEKTLEYFPKDGAAQFNAQVQLAYLDTLEDQHDRALQRLQVPMASFRGSVTVEDAALGDYITGLAYSNKGADAEALAIMDKIVGDKQVSEFRRSWAQLQRATVLAKTDKPKAIEALLAGLELDSDNHDHLFMDLAELRLEAAQEDTFRKELVGYLEKHQEGAPLVMQRLAALAVSWAQSTPEKAAKLVAILDGADENQTLGQEYADSLKEALLAVNSGKGYALARKHLQEWMKKHPEQVPGATVPAELKTPEAFGEKIESLRKAEDQTKVMTEIIRLSLECLTQFEPGEWFEDRLWRLGTYADYMDLNDDQQESPPVLAAVLEACDLLPPGSKANSEGRFLRGRQLVRAEKLEAAATLLQDLSTSKDLDRDWHITAIQRLGMVLVQQKNYEAALKNWDRLEDYLNYAATADDLLRATLLSLQMNRPAQAKKYLKLMTQMKPETRGDAEAKEQLDSLLELAADEQAMQAWWDASAKWWPEWLSLEHKHGTPVPEGELILPLIGSAEELGGVLGNQARAGQKKESFDTIRKLVHAGRWDPRYAAEVAGMLGYLNSIRMSEVTPELRKLVVAMEGAGGIKTASYRRRLQIWAAAVLIESKQAPAALKIADAFFAGESGNPDAMTTAMARLQATAAQASGEKLAPAATQLERLLATQGAVPDAVRAAAVFDLAGVYSKLGRPEAEIVLLERELEHPAVTKTDSAIELLKQRLEVLREGGGAGDAPALAAKAWLAAGKTGWYDHARPKDMQDSKAENADKTIATANGLLPLEFVKLCLLITQDSKQADASRMDALIRLGWYTHAALPSLEDSGPRLEAVLSEKSLPRRTRGLHLDSFLRNAYVTQDREAIRKFGNHPVLAGLQPEDAPHHDIFRRWAALEPTDLAGHKEFGLALLEKQLTYFECEALKRCIMALAFGGKDADARALYEKLGHARFEDTKDKPPLQLAALKMINRAKKLLPYQEEMKALYLKHRPLPAGPPPVKLACKSDVQFNLSEADATAVREGWLKDGTWPRHSLDFWFDLTSDLPHSETRENLAFALLTLALEKAPEDGDRAQLIMGSSGYVDIDNPAAREKLAAILKPYRNRPDAPLTADSLKTRDLLVQMRVGETSDGFTVLTSLRDPRNLGRTRWQLFRKLYADQDKAGLKRLVEMTSVDELMSPLYAGLMTRIYLLLDMKDEAELATEQARGTIYESMTRGWVDPDRRTAFMGLHAAEAIGEPDLVPAVMAQELIPETKHEREKLFLSLLEARLRKDWEACAKHAAEGARLYPTFYDFYLMGGLALGNLGRGEEAVKALQTFLDHVHDDPDCVQARQMLERFSKKQP